VDDAGVDTLTVDQKMMAREIWDRAGVKYED
jgi:hypothetical protein